MPLPPSVRSAIPLVIGLIVGGVGATLFMESMPGADGSPQERANRLEADLKKAQNRLAALEAANAQERQRPSIFPGNLGGSSDGKTRRQTLVDGARSIAEDIREGRPVNPDDIFRASKPLLRDLAPLFDRMRLKQQRAMMDSMAGELARKYHLAPQQQAALKQWFEAKSNEEAKRWTDLLGQDGTRIEDLARASQDFRPDRGLETFMAGVLPPDKLATFRAEQLAERAGRVQNEADMKMQRLDAIVGLDDAQRDQVFGIMARGSREYDPAMVLEGAHGDIGTTPSGDRQASMLAVLRPDQRAAYEAEQQRRRAEAEKNAAAIGLTLPASWEMLESDFR